jgi:flagellar biosynthesis/type III secretory pathway protein FliH
VQQALEVLKDLSADDETQRKAFVRERALRDEISKLASARMEGLQEGEKRGKQEGLQEAKTKMIQSGMSEEQAQAILGL